MKSKLLLFFDKHRFLRKAARSLYFGSSMAIERPRTIEYPWVYFNLKGYEGRLLDVGCVGSLFPLVLASLGFHVYGIDTREYEGPHGGVKMVKGDIRKTEFPDEFFDIVTAVSTIEHVGLGRYRDPVDIDGDKRAMAEIHRIMKRNGTLFLTLPFGNKDVTVMERIYDTRSLDDLLSLYSVEIMDIYSYEEGIWKREDPNSVENAGSARSLRALALVKARKL